MLNTKHGVSLMYSALICPLAEQISSSICSYLLALFCYSRLCPEVIEQSFSALIYKMPEFKFMLFALKFIHSRQEVFSCRFPFLLSIISFCTMLFHLADSELSCCFQLSESLLQFLVIFLMMVIKFRGEIIRKKHKHFYDSDQVSHIVIANAFRASLCSLHELQQFGCCMKSSKYI